MASKEGKTVKELNFEVEKIMDKIGNLEKIMLELKEYVQNKISEMNKIKKPMHNANNEQEKFNCHLCHQHFEAKTDMKQHMQEFHKRIIKCENCTYESSKMAELEIHILANHKDKAKCKCDQCDQLFVSEWRLKKHVMSHSKNTRYCHYFNNAKYCEYEEVGCRFKHVEALECRFKEKCRQKLCQFQHPQVINVINGDMPGVDNSEEDKLNEEIVESEEFDYDIYDEARERFCSVYCYPRYDGHIHYDSLYEDMLDSPNTLEMYDIATKEKSYSYHCKLCGNIFSDRDTHENHMASIHLESDRLLPCIFDECEYKSPKTDNILRHIAVKHQDAIMSNNGK